MSQDVTKSQLLVQRQKPTTTGSFERSKRRFAWLLLLPTLLVLMVVALYPLSQTFYQSLTNARLASAQPVEFVGLQNYRDLLSDSKFRDSIGVTIQFTLITVGIEFLLGLVIALIINSNFRGRGMMRAAMLVPWAIPTVISAQMWKFMFQRQGVLNDLLVNQLGLLDKPVAWLTQIPIASVAAVDIWKTTPFVALLLLAGLQVIPLDIYEAARVDGANKIQQFFSLTLPLLRPAILVTLIFRTLDALRVFDVFFAFFENGRTTQTMAIYNQQQLVSFSKVGYGGAVSVAIFLIIALFVVIYVTFLKVEEA